MDSILERGEKMEMEMEPERQIEISSHWWLSSLPSVRISHPMRWSCCSNKDERMNE